MQARRLTKHMREDIGRTTLRRRVVKLSKRLHAANAVRVSQLSFTASRLHTPSTDHDAAQQQHAASGQLAAARGYALTASQLRPSSPHPTAAGGSPGENCSACKDVCQQITGLQQELSAVRGLLQQLRAERAAQESGPAMWLTAEQHA